MMKKLILSLGMACFWAAALLAQTEKAPIWVNMKPNEAITVKGNLADGAVMKDLSWAWNSAVACFPQTQVRKFTGNHVLYAMDLPSFSEMEILLEPDDEGANFSIYAYEVGTIAANNTVPNLNSCIRCEAEHKWDYKKRGQTQDHTRRIKDILAINNPYQVIIGVVGAEDLQSGGFTLHLKTNTRQ